MDNDITSNPPPKKETISLPLDKDTIGFFRTLQGLIEHPTKGHPLPEHQTEFKKLKLEYDNHMKTMQKQGDLDPFVLELSKSFYDTWVHRTFNEALSPYHRINKTYANTLNELHRDLNENKNHPTFLKSYNEYYDN